MSIPFPGNYDTLCRSAGKAVPVPFHCPCLRCGSCDAFIFTETFVDRGVVIVMEAGRFEYTSWRILLAQCRNCGRWARVLPIELLPRKTYGMRVIQAAMERNLFSLSLRKAAGGMVIAAPIALHYSILWH